MCIPWNSFLSFKHNKEEKTRYFHDTEVNNFFKELLATVNDRIIVIPKGSQYWRAQLGCDYDPCKDIDGKIIDYNAVPYLPERMKPSPAYALEGRINTKRIPCLYLSSNEKTAISEVRPWLGSYVTVVQFEILKEMNIIDCSCCEVKPMNITALEFDKLFKLVPPEPTEATKTVWRWIDKEFSEPVGRDGDDSGYVTTQIIAELFKINGFDRIQYHSLFYNGNNLALFDINSAELVDGSNKVCQVTKIEVDAKQVYPHQFTKQ